MIDEVMFCACGLSMRGPTFGATAKMCPNCDTISPDEYDGRRRRMTDRDYIFKNAWRQRMLKIYRPGEQAA